jgi:hypothetical protein
MAKRKITVTVDEELVEHAHRLDAHASLSSVVNDALSAYVERQGRLVALGDLLLSWETSYGPIPDDHAKDAKEAFDELDGQDAGRSSSHSPVADVS